MHSGALTNKTQLGPMAAYEHELLVRSVPDGVQADCSDVRTWYGGGAWLIHAHEGAKLLSVVPEPGQGHEARKACKSPPKPAPQSGSAVERL